MHYCGVVVGGAVAHLCVLEEERAPEPPVRLRATFYEPAGAEAVARELDRLVDTVVAVAAPQRGPEDGARQRACDAALLRRGVPAQPVEPLGLELYAALAERGIYSPPAEVAAHTGPVEEGAYRRAAVFEVNVDGVFCALQGQRVPAKRHPLGLLRRIEELEDDHVEDLGGDLWHRRLEEIEAAAAALAAHRYAVGHACWVGDPAEGVIVLPGARLPEVFAVEGVIPHVERVRLGE